LIRSEKLEIEIEVEIPEALFGGIIRLRFLGVGGGVDIAFLSALLGCECASALLFAAVDGELLVDVFDSVGDLGVEFVGRLASGVIHGGFGVDEGET
jgi:hypothetical protein